MILININLNVHKGLIQTSAKLGNSRMLYDFVERQNAIKPWIPHKATICIYIDFTFVSVDLYAFRLLGVNKS